jgi:hypothetical protein
VATILPHPHGKRRSRAAPPSGRGCTALRRVATKAANRREGAGRLRGVSMRQSVGTEGRTGEGPWRRARRVAGSGTREAGPPLRPRLAAGHISMHRHDMWWSALNATEPDRARPWPTEIRPHKPCIPTSENRTSGHSGEQRWCLHLLGGAAFAVSVGVSVGVALGLDPTGLERCVRCS